MWCFVDAGQLTQDDKEKLLGNLKKMERFRESWEAKLEREGRVKFGGFRIITPFKQK